MCNVNFTLTTTPHYTKKEIIEGVHVLSFDFLSPSLLPFFFQTTLMAICYLHEMVQTV